MQEETGAAEASVDTTGVGAPATEVQESLPGTDPVAAEAGNVEAGNVEAGNVESRADAAVPDAMPPDAVAPDAANVESLRQDANVDASAEISTETESLAVTEVPAAVAPESAAHSLTESPAEIAVESPSDVSGDVDQVANDLTTPHEEPVPVAEAVFTYQPGDIVPGVITVIGANGIEADLGEGEMAVIPKAELVDGHEPVVGEQIEGTVVRHQAGSGRYVISPKRAHRTRSWTRIEAAFEAGEPISGIVKATTKGGLILDLGMRAFLPESLIDVRKVHDIGSLVGTTMTVKIIECEKITGEQAATERRSEKIVVNRRIMLEAERQAQRDAMFATIKVGDRKTGTVTALTDFGAFVDIGGGEGLIHVSELAHRQVNKPSDVVRVGDSVEVVILDIKPERNKISLSRKAILPSPWDQFSKLHKPGDLVFGTVTGLAAFGVFVTIEGEGFEPVEGLVHISELSRFRVEQASDVVAVGEGVWSQILSIDPDKRRVALSMRRALE